MYKIIKKIFLKVMCLVMVSIMIMVQAQAANLMPNGRQQYFAPNGAPLSGGRVYTYTAGTTTPKNTFSDAAGTIVNNNPVILDSSGSATIFWTGKYKIDVRDSNDVSLSGYPIDNYNSFTQEGANVLDYGADNTGTNDSTAAIQAACDENKLVFFPEGTYKYSTLSISNAVTLQGAGNQATILKTTSLTGNTISFNANGWHVKDLRFDATSNRTAGSYVWSCTRYGSIENCSLTKYFIGFDLDGAVGINIENIDALDGTPSSVSAGGAIIRLGKTNYTGSINISGIVADVNNSLYQPSTGITLGWVDVVSISDTLIIHHTKNLNIVPANGQYSALIQVSNSCFDTAYNGMCIAPASGGQVLRMGVTNTWFGANSSDGIVINGTEGRINGLQFTNSMFFANGAIGANVVGTNVNDIYFDNCFAAANTGNGLQVTQNSKNIVWDGGTLGATHDLGGNGLHGFSTEAGCTGSVKNTNLDGNTLGAHSNPSNVFATSGNTPYEWQTYIPNITAVVGTLTSASGTFNYKIDYKTVTYTLKITITNNGTGAGGIRCTLPFSTSKAFVGAGREVQLGGKMLQGIIDEGGSTMTIFNYDASYPGTNGAILVVSGSYEMS